MCGIVGYIGNRNAGNILVNGLKRLEYRGYDSFGFAFLSPQLTIIKDIGKISDFDASSLEYNSTIGIAHTRWATHGEVNAINAHPHIDCNNSIAIVHNGIIDNYLELKNKLIEKGHNFISETDSEVIAHLIEYYVDEYGKELSEAVYEAVKELKGTYAILCIIDHGHEIIAAKNGSPLVVGVGENEFFVASDILPIIEHTKNIIFPEDGDVIYLMRDEYLIFNTNGYLVNRKIEEIDIDLETIKLGGFEHFMLKEMFEQPEVIFKSYHSNLHELNHILSTQEIDAITLVGCGTSYHAGMCFKYLIGDKIRVNVEYASEYQYIKETKNTLCIFLSQSGETADTISAMKHAKSNSIYSIAITNVRESTIDRMADYTVFMNAGIEISVAATKSFISQIAILIRIAEIMRGEKLCNDINNLREIVERALYTDVENAIKIIREASNVFYMGRGLYFPVALEGALKMKEISYIHAEAFAAGELKHGTIALITNRTVVVAICSYNTDHASMMSSIKEVRARGAIVIGIGSQSDNELKDISTVFISSITDNLLSELASTIIVMQLLAYFTARSLERDIDQPRNLAKSVTVS